MKKVKLPKRKMCEKTYCGDCKWLDLSQYTNSTPIYYWCKEKCTYKDPHTNTSCSSWEKR